MKSSSPGLFFVGSFLFSLSFFFSKASQHHVVNKFLITDSISLLVIALFRYSVHGLVFVGFVFVAVCAFYLAYPTC